MLQGLPQCCKDWWRETQNSKSAFGNWQTTEILIILIQQLEKNKCHIFNIWKKKSLGISRCRTCEYNAHGGWKEGQNKYQRNMTKGALAGEPMADNKHLKASTLSVGVCLLQSQCFPWTYVYHRSRHSVNDLPFLHGGKGCCSSAWL